jgi:hypothetical protein
VTIIPQNAKSPTTGLEGYVYVLGFQSGLIKVGYSGSATKRIQQHRKHASSYGNPATGEWISPLHKGALANEQKLIGYCRRSGSLAFGNEWFNGVTFADVVGFAGKLSFPRVTPEEIREYEQRQEEHTNQFREFMQNSRIDSRMVRMPAQIDASGIDALPDGGSTEEMYQALARILRLTEEEARLLPRAAQRRILEFLTTSWNLEQDVQHLATLHGDSLAEQELHATEGLWALRRDMHAVLQGGAR